METNLGKLDRCKHGKFDSRKSAFVNLFTFVGERYLGSPNYKKIRCTIHNRGWIYYEHRRWKRDFMDEGFS